jgi:ABC-type lipoprotein release transport system permease subunit
MNPLSPFTYYRRHKRYALLLLTLIALTTLGISLMVRVLDSVIEYSGTLDRYLTRFSIVSAIGGVLDPGILPQIRAHPDVAQVVMEKSLYVVMPPVDRGYDLFGVSPEGLAAVMAACDLRLKEGRLLQARTNEIMLSVELADALGLQLGDPIGRSIDEHTYPDIPTELVLVGILESDPGAGSDPAVRLGFVSYEYLASHELYKSSPSSLLVIPKEGRKEAVDHFLETAIASPRTHLLTYEQVSEFLSEGLTFIHLVFGIVDVVVAVVIALGIAMIHQIALAQRLAEFGLLNAVGYHRNRLVGRVALETALVAGAGWLAGLLLSWSLFAWLKVHVYAPRGMELDLANLAPIAFSVLIPLTALAFVTLSTARTLARLDAVAVIERGKLSLEAGEKDRGARGRRAPRSSAKPLSSWTFYRRHRRRSVALALTIALLILGVAFPVFVLSPMVDANRFLFDCLRTLAVVSPRQGDAVDPGTVAQIRNHPAVARVVPALDLALLIQVPPVNQTYFTLYGVPEADLPALVAAMGLHLAEGHLPEPRSNEIVLSRAVALNRDLRVGDRVGRPVYEQDFHIPTEMVVAGILAGPAEDGRDPELWAGFASVEYLSSHELYASQPVSLLVLPAEGRKAELDAWLEGHVASEQTSVATFEARLRQHRQSTWQLLQNFALVEGAVALIAAVGLAVLSYTSSLQRREEFGTLHALGHGRLFLVLRTAWETSSVVGVAWLIGAGVCIVGLITMRDHVFAPRGLTVDLLNPAPWLFTLPIPLVVVAVGAGLVAWLLAKLDPVAIIERRS